MKYAKELGNKIIGELLLPFTSWLSFSTLLLTLSLFGVHFFAPQAIGWLYFIFIVIVLRFDLFICPFVVNIIIRPKKILSMSHLLVKVPIE